ncbi:MAG TPA: GDP-mannose 4,6-dehydratase [Mycobacteriales bacterium]|jgi:GDPmannose 4,6-dehydratase|nr:GDP-mannose 4,6-dehydratase [Mycobacteriales bacterium]
MGSALITGITGQDGGYLAERLTADGWAVHGMVHGDDSDRLELEGRCPGVVLHEGDLRDQDSLAAVIAAAEPDEVYNLAGISSVAFSWQEPVRTADVTAVGAARLLEQTWQYQERRGRAVRFVQASSAEVFGRADVAPQDENTPVRPTSPYGAAKAYAHTLAGVYRARGLAATSLLLYSHESPRRRTTFVTRKITQAAARIARGQELELVLGNLDARRDWGWAPDFVDAMVLAARHPDAEDFVIATGEAHSVRDFAAAAFARAGVADWESRVRVDASLVRPADDGLQVGDASKARKLLGWAPTVGFEELVGRMVDVDLAGP